MPRELTRRSFLSGAVGLAALLAAHHHRFPQYYGYGYVAGGY